MDVFVIVLEDRHSGIGAVGAWDTRDAACEEAARIMADEYGVDPDEVSWYSVAGEVAGACWGDGNMIRVEKVTFHQGKQRELSAS